MAVGVLAAAGAALIPLAAHQAERGGTSWIHALPLRNRVEDAVRLLVRPSPLPLWAGAGSTRSDARALWWLVLVAVLLALAGALLLGTRRERRGALVAFGVGDATLALPLLVGGLGSALSRDLDYLLARNVITGWLPLAVAVAAGLGPWRAGLPAAAVVAAVCAAGVAVTLAIDVVPSRERDDWRLVARSLDGGRCAVVVYPDYHAAALAHYDRALDLPAPGGADLDHIDIVLHLGGGGYRPSVPPPFRETAVVRLPNWTVLHFRAARPLHLGPDELRRIGVVLVDAHAR